MKLTAQAIAEVKRLRPSDNAILRVQVVGGGCSGLSYKLSFEDSITQSGKFWNQDGVTITVDTKSFIYLESTEIGFSDGLNGTGFTFNNPQAKRTCGCGSSFS